MALPEYPITRKEMYLNAIAQEGAEIPEYPVSRVEQYLEYIALNGGGGGGTTNYNDLNNKPQINGVTLSGNKTTQELGITASGAEVFDDYETAVDEINAWAADHRGVGDNVYIRAESVPDLWVSGVEETSVPYTYTTDAAIIAALEADSYVQFGYYKLSALETQKVSVPTIKVDDTQVQQLDLYSATLTLYEVGSTTPVNYKIYAEEA